MFFWSPTMGGPFCRKPSSTVRQQPHNPRTRSTHPVTSFCSCRDCKSVVPISAEESAASTTVRGIWEKNREGLTSEKRDRLWNLLYEYRHSFSTGPHGVGRTPLVQHSINTGDAQPIHQRPRRLPKARQATADQMIQEMRDAGIIEPSESPWVSLVVMAKKDRSSSFCVDYRPLNDKTVKDSYPLPWIDESINFVAGSAWFSSLDLQSGYWQVAMAPEDKP